MTPLSRPSLNPYPITANAALIDTDQIRTYCDIIFSGMDISQDTIINLRGIGERGSIQEGKFRDDIMVQPAFTEDLPALVASHAERWGQYEVATFCIPGLLNGSKGGSDAVEQMSCILLDLDADCDTNEAVEWLTENVGEPTMIIRSGGTNACGTPKRHLYWRLSDGYREIAKIVELRHILAARCGGDPQFGFGERGGGAQKNGRAHQPIRIPGTIHAKGGKTSVVTLERWDDSCTYSLEEIGGKIAAMPLAPWLSAAFLEAWSDVDTLGAAGPSSRAGLPLAPRKLSPLGKPQFSMQSGAEHEPAGGLLEREIRQGGEDGITRYDAFNSVAGHFLHLARKREYTAAESFEKVRGWVLVNMKPAWPDAKIQAEWQALLNKEIRERGPLLAPERYQSLFSPSSGADRGGALLGGESSQDVEDEHSEVVPFDPREAAAEPGQEILPHQQTLATTEASPAPAAGNPLERAGGQESPLMQFAAHRWVTEPEPEMPYLVEGCLCCGEQHMFAAEGGAGKSFTMLDLAMKIATKGNEPDAQLTWLGQPVLRGGTAVLILNEDSKNTIHRRILRLNQDNLLARAGDKFIPLPMPSLGGAFTLSDRDGGPTQKWGELFDALRQIPDLSLVVMDTFSTMLHGPEIDSTIINEMMRQANQLTGETGTAMLWLHHVRKGGDEPIRGIEDMKNAVRGSTAIIGAMRLVMGMWRASDWERRCKALKIKPDRDMIWRWAVVKTNLDEATPKEKTLARVNGRLEDLSEDDPFNRGNNDLRAAWLVVAVREAAKAGHPLSKGGKNATDGLYARRDSLPDELKNLGRMELPNLIDWALERKLIVACAAKGGAAPKWLDIPHGPYASNEAGEDIAKGAWTPPDWNDWTWDGGQGKCVKVNGSGAPARLKMLLPASARM